MLAEVVSTEGWAVVQALSVVLALALAAIAFIRQIAGKPSERQVEPTQLAAITVEIKGQTVLLAAINREVGEVKTSVLGLESQMEGMHHRVGAISRDVAATTARVEGLERREGIARHA